MTLPHQRPEQMRSGRQLNWCRIKRGQHRQPPQTPFPAFGSELVILLHWQQELVLPGVPAVTLHKEIHPEPL